MKEIISIGIGQFGIRTTEDMFKEFTDDHSIDTQGVRRANENPENNQVDFPHIFFEETEDSKYRPRAFFLDTDCQAIDNVRSGHFGKLFTIDSYTCGKQSAAGNWAKAYYGENSELI